MDYREFEQHVADYVEGALDSELQQRMDAARAADPALDQLARLHEQILAAFAATPPVEAPAGLAERIYAAAEVREQLAAAEQRAFRRGIWLGIFGAALGTAALAIMLFMLDLRTEAATLETATAAGGNWIAQATVTLYGWLNAGQAAMSYKVTVPVIGRLVPVYILLICGLITGVLAYFREELMEAVDSF